MTAIGLSLLAVMGFGSAAVLARLGMQRAGAMPVTLISLCLSFLATAVLMAAFARDDLKALPPVVIAWCLMLGTLNFLGGRNLSYLAIGRIGAARAGAIVGTSAVFASILAITVTGERPHWLVPAGAVIVVAGLATSLGRSIIESSGAAGRTALVGYLVALSAAACYGSTNVVVKQLTLEYTSPLVVAAISLFFGMLLVAPVAGKATVKRLRQGEETPRFIIYAGLSGLAAAVGVNCTYLALQRADVSVVSPIVSANPLFTLLLVSLFLSRLEQVNRWLVIGTGVTVSGVALVVLGSTL